MNIDFLLKHTRSSPDQVAVVSGEQSHTFGDIGRAYAQASQMLADMGIASGGVVAVRADYSPMSIALVLALIERNCILVPISNTIKAIESYLRIAEVEHLLDVAGDSAVPRHVQTGYTPAHPLLLQLRAARKPGLVLFSSGTTGEPKGAVHDLESLLEKFKKPGKTLKTISFLLFDHIGGFNTMMHTLANAGTIVTIPSRQVEDVCRAIERHQVELLPTSPTFLNMLLLNRVFERFDLSCLKVISYGTEPMPESTLQGLHAILPDVQLKQTYGLSELGIMGTKSESSDSLWLKVGGEGFETKIVDGILMIRARSAMLGYLNAPSPFDKDGWFDTKDKVEVKGDYIRILGRTTDIINVGGEKVYPVEVESVLLKCPGVLDARVFSEKNPLMGQMVVAEVSVAPENNHREFIKTMRSFCKANLEAFKIPARFVLTENALCGDRLKKKR